MRKGLLTLVLALTVVLPTVWAYDFSATSPSGHTLYYEIISGTNVGVVRPGTGLTYNNYVTGNVVIPATVVYNSTTYNVTELCSISDYGSFEGCSGLTSVTIPNSVTSIGNYAFYNCSALTSVTIPNSIISIGKYAFSGCSGLTTLNFNAINCSDFTYDYYSEYLPFYGCPISTINIGDSVQYIPAYFAYDLDSLTTVSIGKSVTSIGSYAFRYCNGLTTLNFNAINCSDFTYDDYYSEYPPFYNCPISTINIGDSVQRIPAYFAYNLDSLTSVTIPNSIISIGNSAFRSCNSLTTLNFNAINCSNFTYNTSSSHNSQYPPFYNCPISTINIGDSVQRIPNYFAYNLHSLTSVTIPNSVTSIGKYAFYDCSGLASVTIPNSVTSIRNSAFRSCSSLTTLNFNAINCSDFTYDDYYSEYPPFYGCPISTITIGDSVQRIPAYFAYDRNALTSITIPNSVTSIGNSAFRSCSSLTTLNFNAINCCNFSSGSSHPFYDSPIFTINIGDSVQQIPAYIAYNLESLTSITIPNSVTSIGSHAFSFCSGLTSVTIPNSVTSIGSYAFYDCSGLTSVTIPNNVDTIRNYTFYGCTGLTSITIPDSVTYIGYSAFNGCSSLDSVDIPNSVTTIGGSAFNGCSSLVSVDIPNSVTTIGGSAFSGCSSLVSVSISNNIDTIRNSTFEYCSSLSSITIPNNVRYIGEKAFYRNSNLRILNFNAINCDDFTNDSYHQFYECPISAIVIGDSVMRIPAYFNYSLDSLSSLTIGHNITSLNSTMIDNCTNLRTLNFNAINCNDLSLEFYPFYNAPIATINIGDSVQRIPAHFAYDIDSLTSITIPDSVTYIGNAAFNGCNSLSSATIGSSVASIGDSAFSYCTSLDSIVIPNSVTLIGNYAFDSCSSLVSASIDSSVVTIGNSAFKDCSSLSSIIVPNSVTSIGNSAFKNCSNLFLAIISNNIEAIEDYTFYNCSSLGSITLNNSITSIGDSTFYNCSSLDTIIIPNSVTTIGKSAFGNCANLAFATISSGINRIQESTFENCNSLATITIPNSVANIADKAFNGCYNLREVVSLAVLPPALGANIFSGTAILKVPCGSLDYYTSASAGWSQYFVGIEEMCSNIVITVTSANESMGTVLGGGEYEFGTEVTITATPNQGYRFVSWNDGNTDNPRTITVTEDATYIASFEEGVGIESRDMLSELTFYPNPTSGIITFNRSDIMKVEVLDAMGRTVEVYENAYTIDISKLAKGYYAMRITTAEGVAVRKVIRK